MNKIELKKTIKSEPYRPGISIRNFLIIPFTILITTMLAGLTYLSFQKGQDAVEQIKLVIQERTLEQLQDRIASYMVTAHRLNEATENFISKGHLDIKNPLTLQDFFWSQLKIHRNVNYIYFGYKEGGIILIARRANGSFVVRQSDTVAGDFPAGKSKVIALDSDGNRADLIEVRNYFDSRKRPWYKKAIQQKGPIWTEIYPFFLENTLGITAARPLYDENQQLLGVISTDILLTTLNKVLKLIKPTERSELFIFEKNGALIASTSDQKPFNDEGEELKRIHTSESTSPIVKAAYNKYTSEYANIPINAQSATRFDILVDEQKHLVEIFSFKDKYGLDWQIGLTVSEQDLLGPVHETLKPIIYFGFGALLLSIIVCIFFGQQLTRPLLNLEVAAGNLALGQANSLAEPSSIRELHSLAHSFNAMAKKVQLYISELEDKNRDLNLEIDNRHEAERKLKKLKDEIDIKQRTQLAGELHDNIGQSLQAINLGLKMLEKTENKNNKNEIQISELVEEIGNAITQLRDIIERQRPIFLDQMDIISALEHYGQKITHRAGCNFIFNTNIKSLKLAREIKEPIFLIFQEALNNATKYARASSIKISIEQNPDKKFIMMIEDDGIGFDTVKSKKEQSGFGLSLMPERAESIGGFLKIVSNKNSGTQITLEAPIHD